MSDVRMDVLLLGLVWIAITSLLFFYAEKYRAWCLRYSGERLRKIMGTRGGLLYIRVMALVAMAFGVLFACLAFTQ